MDRREDGYMLGSNHASLTLLIAEDHPDVQGLLRDFMDSWGYHADIVSNGLEAVQHARAGTYDLCLMDRRMSVMDGLTAVETIRRRTPYFPILMFSFDPPPPQSYLTKKGIDEWIEKDCDPSYLHERIMEWGNTRTISIAKHGNQTTVKREMPMDAQHAQKVRKLKEQHLSLMSVFGTSTEATFVVNEKIPTYIEQEFADNQKPSVKFLDHTPDAPGRCCLFARTSLVIKTFMLEEDFLEEKQAEMKMMQSIAISTEE
jgi:CheY-like chemotaxis protein